MFKGLATAVGGIGGLGTGVATALAVNVGTAGAFVVQGGALGTPSSGVGTNITGVTASAVAVGGITGLGTGVATGLAVNVGTAGSPVLNGGVLGTPSSGVGTNITGVTASAVAVGGITGLGANVATALAVAIGSAGAPVLFNGAGGTPSSLVLTNATGDQLGTTTNNAATALHVGEYIESVVSGVSFGASGAWGDLNSISLTAGDWDVTLNLVAGANGATVTAIEGGISITTGNDATGLVVGSNRISGREPNTLTNAGLAVANYRMSLASTTTVYGKISAVFTVATPLGYGRLSARRVR